jgi:hypothetical protein
VIINIRGACGAGKSSVVRSVLGRRDWGVIKQRPRRQPVGYVSVEPTRLFVPGHYEIHMGGIDTFDRISEPFHWIRAFADSGFDVVFEGKCQEDDARYLLDLKKWGLVVLHLDVAVEDAVRGVRERPSASAIRTELIERSHRKAERDCQRLEKTKWALVQRLGRADAVKRLTEIAG